MDYYPGVIVFLFETNRVEECFLMSEDLKNIKNPHKRVILYQFLYWCTCDWLLLTKLHLFVTLKDILFIFVDITRYITLYRIWHLYHRCHFFIFSKYDSFYDTYFAYSNASSSPYDACIYHRFPFSNNVLNYLFCYIIIRYQCQIFLNIETWRLNIFPLYILVSVKTFLTIWFYIFVRESYWSCVWCGPENTDY